VPKGDILATDLLIRSPRWLGGFDIDHELESYRVLDRKITRLLALENTADIDADW